MEPYTIGVLTQWLLMLGIFGFGLAVGGAAGTTDRDSADGALFSGLVIMAVVCIFGFGRFIG